tara:strand:+ start:874 stop:2007 length:1134 start_codon:yes stop_codon:yes gene_type:complete
LEHKFIGQWKAYSDSGSFVVANLAQNGAEVTGRVAVFETVKIENETIHFWSWSFFKGNVTSDNTLEGASNHHTIHHHFGELMNDEYLQALKDKSGIEFPGSTKFKGILSEHSELIVEWDSNFPSGQLRHDKVKLLKKGSGSSEVAHKKMSWSKFKEFSLNQKDGVIFRGQGSDWRLQTSYHRTGHADIIDYLDKNIPEVEHHINASTTNIYDSTNDRSLGALLNLAQHHGYPTPLLDWTKSPYVAAFFAFQDRGILKEDGSISIFMFDESIWSKNSGRVAQLRVPAMVVRTIELPCFGNARVLPQQAITMYSNVDDIEYILLSNENTPGQFLRAISIPSSEAEIAMRDLSLMGITWGSMFPGLDGVCKQLNARHFGT